MQKVAILSACPGDNVNVANDDMRTHLETQADAHADGTDAVRGASHALDSAMAELADGDRSQMDPVFRGLWPIVLRYCEKLVGHGQDAEDCAQGTMEKVFSQASSYDKSFHVTSWALAIATWECRTLRRKKKRSVEHTEQAWRDGMLSSAASDASGSASENPEEALVQHELLETAEQAMGALSERDREILQTAFQLGSGEVSAAHNKNPALSALERKQKQRALERLRRIWRSMYEP